MRNKREKEPNAVYHVIARANRGEFILQSTKMKKIFMKVLRLAKKKYDFALKNFCIMSNHVHLMIQPLSGTDLSRLMQWILSVFAQIFNKTLGLKGHVWYDRFKSRIISSLSHYLKTFLYINENPIKAGIVKSTEDYKFGGMMYIRQNNYRLIEPPDPLIKDLLQGLKISISPKLD